MRPKPLNKLMAKCPECSSELAGNDIFCPYCGISIAPTDAPAPESEDSLANTIINHNLGSFPKPVEPSQYESAVEPEALHLEHEKAPDPLARDETQVGTNDAHAESNEEVEAESSVIPPELQEPADIPVPSFISNIGKTSGSIPKSTSEFSIELAQVSGTVQNDTSPAEQTARDQTNMSGAGEVSTDGELFRDKPASADRRISRPSVELENPQPNTAFDSVRIMAGTPSGQEDVNTRIQGIDRVTSARLEKPPSASIAESPKPEEPISHTAPNIGRIDTDGRKGTKLKPLSEGVVLIGRYEIVRKIGGGGMGAVYLASDNNLGGVLRAVKEMVQGHIEEEQQEKSISDFKRESMILSTLDHAAIPTIYDYFYDDKEGRFYLVMKYISGGDLSSRLRAAPAGKLDEIVVTEWAIQITDVLDYLHNQPSTIVYRDLKPSNIMIDGNTARIMLIDFGIARSIGQKEEKGVTAVGTMGYAPPELFSGNVEPRSDIYSLGSTMFHLLTGADPQSNPLLIFDFQKNPRPRQINPQLSDQMERILMRAVEYSADARFKDAAEMRRVLEEHFANLKSGALSFGVSEAPASVSLANQAVFCGFCGQRIVATDLFCAFCGSKQPLAQQGVHSEIYSKPSVTAKLIVEGTSELSTPAFALQKDDNLLGRRDPMSNIFPEVDLSKYDPQTKISRRHARIWREGGQYMVEDLGSSNGTMLGSKIADSLRLVPLKPHVLTHGDTIKIGDTTLHFVVG